jgi:HNH endonuclease
VTSFEQWQFPRTLPPEWNDLAIQRGGASRACCLSLIHQALDWSHIVPQSESEWFRANLQGRRGCFRSIDHADNLITLRADIHRVFDSKMWCVVLKEGRLVCQTFVPYKSREFPDQFMKIYHNVELQPIFDKSEECLFARIAWTVLPLEHFCAVRQDKAKTFIIKLR